MTWNSPLVKKLSHTNGNIAIIQARMGSTRLPGKMLADIAGRPMLLRVVQRATAARQIDRIVVATTTLSADDPIAALCRDWNIDCFRGDELDVLGRYVAAARHYGARLVTRITADCPLLDPNITDRVIEAFIEASAGDSSQRPDYASNTLERTWPRGLDTEVFTTDALLQAAEAATATYHRTHVTPYIYEHPERFRLLSVRGDEDWSRLRWTVDEAEDLELVRAVYARLPDDETDWHAVIELMTTSPELSTINAHIRQKESREG